jgi:hypothetical protein
MQHLGISSVQRRRRRTRMGIHAENEVQQRPFRPSKVVAQCTEIHVL